MLDWNQQQHGSCCMLLHLLGLLSGTCTSASLPGSDQPVLPAAAASAALPLTALPTHQL
jgi:hypothetical protein